MFMRNSIYESYKLKFEHFAIMLSVRNIKSLFGFERLKANVDDVSGAYSLSEMIRLNLIVSDGKKMEVCEPYAKIIDFIGKAKYVLLLDNSAGTYFCVYIADKEHLIVSELSERVKNTVILTCVDLERFFNEFLDDSFFPNFEEECSEKIIYNDSLFEIANDLSMFRKSQSADFVLSATMLDLGKSRVESSVVYASAIALQGSNFCVVNCANNGFDACPYGKEEYINNIKKSISEVLLQ